MKLSVEDVQDAHPIDRVNGRVTLLKALQFVCTFTEPEAGFLDAFDFHHGGVSFDLINGPPEGGSRTLDWNDACNIIRGFLGFWENVVQDFEEMEFLVLRGGKVIGHGDVEDDDEGERPVAAQAVEKRTRMRVIALARLTRVALFQS
ncbi:uncharacterized protein KY384_001258 [Bacidia gigantensis]|uniref:uncharacterized protein n=1 Tax=Bacidia gigantensis TaxID=2732470 RepID=UPI001D042C49|nr:uncharacterized protein KY384_001258 [Bacidia gigantensis]KAG8534413.1 hypothetical protein KY384_001258 [Bacidia gigantensis]